MDNFSQISTSENGKTALILNENINIKLKRK